MSPLNAPDDPLGPAAGILTALALSAVFWIAVIVWVTS